MVDRYVEKTVQRRILEQVQRLHASVDALQARLEAEKQPPSLELWAAALAEGQRLAARQQVRRRVRALQTEVEGLAKLVTRIGRLVVEGRA